MDHIVVYFSLEYDNRYTTVFARCLTRLPSCYMYTMSIAEISIQNSRNFNVETTA